MAEPGQPDLFDLLPDPILLLILNRVSDVKTLLRLRPLSRRLSSAVPLADRLLLRVDQVISSNDAASSFLSSLLTSILSLVSATPPPEEDCPSSPAQILRAFDAIRDLRIELPSGDLKLDKGTTIKWVARFGKSLKSCVIFAFRDGADCDNGGLKMRVVWTISALIAASARHFMIGDVVREQQFLSRLVVEDRENEGTVVMDKDGLREFRESWEEEGEEDWWRKSRTTVPAVGMRMRHEARLELSGGTVMEGATLVVVRPLDVVEGDEWLVAEAFGNGGGVYAEAVERLLKSRSYVLEMNSF